MYEVCGLVYQFSRSNSILEFRIVGLCVKFALNVCHHSHRAFIQFALYCVYVGIYIGHITITFWIYLLLSNVWWNSRNFDSELAIGVCVCVCPVHEPRLGGLCWLKFFCSIEKRRWKRRIVEKKLWKKGEKGSMRWRAVGEVSKEMWKARRARQAAEAR